MQTTFIPEEFVKKYRKVLGKGGYGEKDAKEFFAFCKKKIPKSIWTNSLKIPPKKLQKILQEKGWKLKQLPFHENAFSLHEISLPGKSAEFEKGLFNLQEKISMLPAIVLNPKADDEENVLDMTAAPGNKTLQLSCLMKGKGKIFAVEKNFVRYKSLCFNVKKFGMKNVTTFCKDALQIKKEDFFEKVLLDAPCSSEGLVRKKRDALKEWSQALVERKARVQKRLIVKGFDCLKEKGEMVYSVCSLSPEECEEVVQHLLEKRNASIEKVSVKGITLRNGLQEFNGKVFSEEIKKCCRSYPQDNDSQAFFFAKIRKEGI